MLTQVLDGMKTAVGLVLLVLAVIGAIAIGRWFLGDNIREETASVVLKVERRNALVTGYAFVSVLRFNQKVDGPVVEDWAFMSTEGLRKAPIRSEDVQGMCNRLYKVAFGYPDLALALKSATNMRPPPSVMAIEAVEAYSRGDSMTDAICDGFDVVSRDASVDKRLGAILRRMAIDQLLVSQYEQGCRLLDAYSASSGAPTDQKSEDQCFSIANAQSDLAVSNIRKDMAQLLESPRAGASMAAEDRGLDNPVHRWIESITKVPKEKPHGQYLGESAGALGSLTITLSTVGSLSHDKGILLWKSEEFSVRRDITSILYGSAIRSSTWKTGKSKPQLVVELEEPTILSRDRRTDFSLTSSGFDKKHKLRSSTGGSRSEANVLESIRAMLAQIESQALRLSRANIRVNLENQAQARDATLVLTFR